MIRKLIPALLTATIALALLTGCPAKGGKANKASYASDGVTMFVGNDNRACSGNTNWCSETGNGKLKFGKTYTAEAAGAKKEFPDCEWSIYTINAQGKLVSQGSGTEKRARINVERPTRVHVFLKSDGCGDWK